MNIIYIVLIVGSIIWSIVKKFIAKTEDAQNPPQPKQAPTPQMSLEDIFRKLADEIEPQTIPKPVVAQPITQQKPKPIVMPQLVMNDALATEKRVVFNQPVFVEQELPQRNFTVDLEGTADWQRAFVYSEIFNRKY